MALLLALSYVVHVVSAGLWTGGVLYATYAVVPAATAGELGPAAFERAVGTLLQATRWTGLALPATGAYQIWELYPVATLLGTTRGHLVVGMAVLWALMNGLVEAGVYRMRTRPAGFGRHLVERFAVDDDADVAARVAAGRPYLLGAAGLGVLLLVDAALLAGGGA